MKSRFDVNWQDDDGDNFEIENGFEESSHEFEDLLKEKQDDDNEDNMEQNLAIGQKVQGRVCHIPEHGEQIVIELGEKNTGFIERRQLIDENEELRVKVGDTLTVYVLSNRDGEIELSLNMSAKQSREHGLKIAYENKMPIKAKVMAVNKGGYELMVAGKKAFCPLSQISSQFVDDPNSLIGKEFDFLIKQCNPHNIVLSRTELLRQGSDVFAKELAAKIASGKDVIVESKITAFKEFGLIVDIGHGLEALLHKREAGYGNFEKLEEYFHMGQTLKVKVLSITQKEGDRHTRVAVSLKALEADPWSDIQSKYHSGQSLRGEVTRLSDFGAFVELERGIEGLIHISQMSWEKRVLHPKEILSVGQKAEVRVLEVDTLKQRISLTLKHAEDDPWLKVADRLHVGTSVEAKVVELKAQGAVVEIYESIEGFIPLRQLRTLYKESYRKKASPGNLLPVILEEVDHNKKSVRLALEGGDNSDKTAEDYAAYEKVRSASPVKKEDATGSFGALLMEKLKGR